MKFLRNKKLNQLGAYLLVLTVFIFVVQYFIVGSQIAKLEEAELKKEFIRITQIANQQISLDVQEYLNGRKEIASEIASHLDQQEHRLKVLSEGGRIDQRDEFIKPLRRLAGITFLGLKENWKEYKQAIYLILAGDKPLKVTPDIQLQSDSSTSVNPTAISLLVNTAIVTPSAVKYQGLALTMSGWYDKLILDIQEEVQDHRSSLEFWRMGLMIINFLLFGGLFYLFQENILKPLRVLKLNIAEHRHSADIPQNEIGEVAQNINHTIENLKDATEFVSAIGQGDLSMNYKESLDKNYVHGNNKLADSLIEMQLKLRELNENEQKRQWANEGLAKFVDILRSSNDNLHILGDKIISGLVQYTRSNQGALYILNDEDEANRFLELISLFAFDLKKYEQQRIKPGQGILGQTFLEKDTTYLTSLPEEYIRITSGLGGAGPKSILIVPLKVDKDVYGLVELASFNEFQPHEIAFVEKLGETIASTLGSVRAAQKNKHLIEQFQQQTEEMRAQEEEMRQNMEELQATQEEVIRKEKGYINKIQELETALRETSGRDELSSALREFSTKEQEYIRKVQLLEKKVEDQMKKGDDWEVAAELAKALRANLEAIKITGEELNRKRSI
jgi:GAF domain-containing protein